MRPWYFFPLRPWTVLCPLERARADALPDRRRPTVATPARVLRLRLRRRREATTCPFVSITGRRCGCCSCAGRRRRGRVRRSSRPGRRWSGPRGGRAPPRERGGYGGAEEAATVGGAIHGAAANPRTWTRTAATVRPRKLQPLEVVLVFHGHQLSSACGGGRAATAMSAWAQPSSARARRVRSIAQSSCQLRPRAHAERGASAASGAALR